jgi:L-fuconolactonase
MRTDQLEIVDAQVHLWGANTPERPWSTSFAGAAHGPAELTAETMLAAMDAAGVNAAVIVPPSFEGDRNDLGLAAAHAYPERFLTHGRFDLSTPAAAEAMVAELADPGLRGVRITFNAGASTWLADGTLEWFWDFAAERGVPVSVFPMGDDLQLVGGIAERHPRLKVSIDHLATSVPSGGYDTLDRIRQLEPLAKWPNVAVKASALPLAFPSTYSVDVVRTVVDHVVGWFGPARVFWGSDVSRYDREPLTYGDTLEVFQVGIAHLGRTEQRLVMGAALREWLDWPA